MAKTRDIQRRIKSVNNTKKITRAMEMVAATKMRRATEAVLRTRAYADLSWRIALSLAANKKNGETVHPLLVRREKVKKVALILFSSNRGLCGSYNSAVINKAEQSIRKHEKQTGAEIDFFLVGKKGAAVYRYFGYNIAAEFKKEDTIAGLEASAPIASLAVGGFLQGDYDKILIVYTDYLSALKQVPRIKQILPISLDAPDEYLGFTENFSRAAAWPASEEFLFEPSPAAVLEEMLPRLVGMQIYQAMLEANASEHSARMAAMHQATAAAGDMASELTQHYNKSRQAAITAEIAEIAAGADAITAE